MEDVVGQQERILHGAVGEGIGGGLSHGTRHIRHAVMDHVFITENRIGVQGGLNGFNATTLVDGKTHHHRVRLRLPNHFARYGFRGFRTGAHNGSDHEICFFHRTFNVYGIGIHGVDGVFENIIQILQPERTMGMNPAAEERIDLTSYMKGQFAILRFDESLKTQPAFLHGTINHRVRGRTRRVAEFLPFRPSWVSRRAKLQ